MNMIFVDTASFNFESIMPFIWLGIIVLATILEFATAELVSVWFIFAGIVSMILSFIPGIPYFVEIIVFVVLSVLQIIFLRKVFKKLFKSKVFKSNSDSMIGQIVPVISDIKPLELGEIKYKGIVWSAESEEEIKAGTYVVIKSIEGNRLKVQKDSSVKGE